MPSPSPSEYYDAPANPLTKSPPPSPPLLALPLRGPIYEHLCSSISDVNSDTESAYAHDAATATRPGSRESATRGGTDNVVTLRRMSNLSLASHLPGDDTQISSPTPSESHSPRPASQSTPAVALPAPPPPPPPSSPSSHRPYWSPHHRSISNASYRSLIARQEIDRGRLSRQQIVLEDYEHAHLPEERTLWAKHVSVDDYVVIGNPQGLGTGAFVVWNCTLVLDSGPMKLIKRYSEFDDLRRRLIKVFPLHEAAMPPLPPKSVMSKFRPDFLEKRKAGLSYFLNCVLLHPEFAASAVVKDWLFKRGKGVVDLDP